MDRKIRLLIADDHPQAREGLRALLSTMAEIDVVGEAEDGMDAVRLVGESHPDVVLIDAHMRGADGVQATRAVKAGWPGVKVIVLTLYPSYRSDALDAGADAFLLKGRRSQELLDAVRTLGNQLRPPESGIGGP
jgi:DNA-binding NarL/FixJ family response regulator